MVELESLVLGVVPPPPFGPLPKALVWSLVGALLGLAVPGFHIVLIGMDIFFACARIQGLRPLLLINNRVIDGLRDANS